jgi:hypothetical protein
MSAESIDPVTFGDPLSVTSYELCVFDSFNLDPVTGTPSLLFSAALPAGSNWKQTASGFVFKNAADKLKVRLKGGEVGRAKILVNARGAAYPVQYLPPLAVPVHVQLRTAEGFFPASAYYSLYYNPVTSTEKHYKGQFPEP